MINLLQENRIMESQAQIAPWQFAQDRTQTQNLKITWLLLIHYLLSEKIYDTK